MLTSLKWKLNAIADCFAVRGMWKMANCIDRAALAIHRLQERLSHPHFPGD